MEKNPITSASVMVSFYQVLFVTTLVGIYKLIFRIELPSPKYFLVVMISILAINYFRYEKNFDIEGLRYRWKDESQVDSNKRLVMLIGYLVGSIMFSIVVGLSTQ